MTDSQLFCFAKEPPKRFAISNKNPFARYQPIPWVSLLLLVGIGVGCLMAEQIAPNQAEYLHLQYANQAPNSQFWFGTDTLGRDLFACVWYGGRLSLWIGLVSALVSLGIGIVYGGIAALSGHFVERCMLRGLDIVSSIPSILLILFLKSIFPNQQPWVMGLVIGCTIWATIAKVVYIETKMVMKREYCILSSYMGASRWHTIVWHLVPNLVGSVLYMSILNIRSGMMIESTLSFMGMGLPLEKISWGSMLSLSEKALLTKSWWIVVIPGAFLTVTLVCVGNVGEWIRNIYLKKEKCH